MRSNGNARVVDVVSTASVSPDGMTAYNQSLMPSRVVILK